MILYISYINNQLILPIPESFNIQTTNIQTNNVKTPFNQSSFFPIQHKIFPITEAGATLGRKQSNSISFSHISNGVLVGLDSSISGEHAEIRVCPKTKDIRLYDGVQAASKDEGGNKEPASHKSSTNGTWLRLSAMHTSSAKYKLEDNMEILIGTVRFLCTVSDQIVEKDIFDQDEVRAYEDQEAKRR